MNCPRDAEGDGQAISGMKYVSQGERDLPRNMPLPIPLTHLGILTVLLHPSTQVSLLHEDAAAAAGRAARRGGGDPRGGGPDTRCLAGRP